MRQAILIQLLLVITLINCEKINLVSYQRFDDCIQKLTGHHECEENDQQCIDQEMTLSYCAKENQMCQKLNELANYHMESDADAILDDSILYCFAECKPDQKVSPIFFKFYEDEVNCAIDRK